MDAASVANRVSHLYGAADGIVDGAVLFAHALLSGAKRPIGPAMAMARIDGPRLFIGPVVQRSDGHRAVAGVAL